MTCAPFILFRNGSDGWCAVPAGFRSCFQDPIGYGQTRVEAISALLAHPEFILRARRGEWPQRPGLEAFIEAPTPTAAVLNGGPALEISDQRAAVRRRMIKLVSES